MRLFDLRILSENGEVLKTSYEDKNILIEEAEKLALKKKTNTYIVDITDKIIFECNFNSLIKKHEFNAYDYKKIKSYIKKNFYLNRVYVEFEGCTFIRSFENHIVYKINVLFYCKSNDAYAGSFELEFSVNIRDRRKDEVVNILNFDKNIRQLKKIQKVKCKDDIAKINTSTFYSLVVIDEMLAQSDYFKHLEENNRYIDCDIAQEKYDIVYVSKSKKLLREKLSEYYYLCKGKKLIEIYDAAIVKCHIDETFDCVIYDEIVEYAQIDEDYFKELMFDIKSLQDINVLDLDILTKEHFNVCDGYNECEEGDLYRASTYLQNVSYDGIIIVQTILYNKQIDKYTIDIEDVESVMYGIIEVNNFGLLDKLGKLRLIKFEKDENGTLRCI